MFSNIHTFKDFVMALIGVINLFIPFLISIALVAFLYTGVRLVWSAGGKHRKEHKDALVWSVVALFVTVSLWGILNILLDTFFPGLSPQRTPNSLVVPPPSELDNGFILTF